MSNTPHVPMDDAHLKQYAANAAREVRLGGTVPCRALRKALRSSLNTVCRAREALNLWNDGRSALPGAAEWLLDNHYLAVREGERALEALKRARPVLDAVCFLRVRKYE